MSSQPATENLEEGGGLVSHQKSPTAGTHTHEMLKKKKEIF